MSYLNLPCVRSLCCSILQGIASPREEVERPVEETVEQEGDTSQDTDSDNDLFGSETIRSDLLFQKHERLGSWKVLLSGSAVQHLRQHKKSGSLPMITKKIK